MTNERELLANLIPLGFTERDGVSNVLDAADRILEHGFHLGGDADALAAARAEAATYRLAIAEALEAGEHSGYSPHKERMMRILGDALKGWGQRTSEEYDVAFGDGDR